MTRIELTSNRNRFTLTHMGQDNGYPKAVAAELRAQMARQQKSIADLADMLGMERQAAKKRYDGDREMTVSEVDRAAAWLGIERRVLFGVEAVAS